MHGYKQHQQNDDETNAEYYDDSESGQPLNARAQPIEDVASPINQPMNVNSNLQPRQGNGKLAGDVDGKTAADEDIRGDTEQNIQVGPRKFIGKYHVIDVHGNMQGGSQQGQVNYEVDSNQENVMTGGQQGNGNYQVAGYNGNAPEGGQQGNGNYQVAGYNGNAPEGGQQGNGNYQVADYNGNAPEGGPQGNGNYQVAGYNGNAPEGGQQGNGNYQAAGFNGNAPEGGQQGNGNYQVAGYNGNAPEGGQQGNGNYQVAGYNGNAPEGGQQGNGNYQVAGYNGNAPEGGQQGNGNYQVAGYNGNAPEGGQQGNGNYQVAGYNGNAPEGGQQGNGNYQVAGYNGNAPEGGQQGNGNYQASGYNGNASEGGQQGNGNYQVAGYNGNVPGGSQPCQVNYQANANENIRPVFPQGNTDNGDVQVKGQKDIDSIQAGSLEENQPNRRKVGKIGKASTKLLKSNVLKLISDIAISSGSTATDDYINQIGDNYVDNKIGMEQNNANTNQMDSNKVSGDPNGQNVETTYSKQSPAVSSSKNCDGLTTYGNAQRTQLGTTYPGGVAGNGVMQDQSNAQEGFNNDLTGGNYGGHEMQDKPFPVMIAVMPPKQSQQQQMSSGDPMIFENTDVVDNSDAYQPLHQISPISHQLTPSVASQPQYVMMQVPQDDVVGNTGVEKNGAVVRQHINNEQGEVAQDEREHDELVKNLYVAQAMEKAEEAQVSKARETSSSTRRHLDELMMNLERLNHDLQWAKQRAASTTERLKRAENVHKKKNEDLAAFKASIDSLNVRKTDLVQQECKQRKRRNVNQSGKSRKGVDQSATSRQSDDQSGTRRVGRMRRRGQKSHDAVIRVKREQENCQAGSAAQSSSSAGSNPEMSSSDSESHKIDMTVAEQEAQAISAEEAVKRAEDEMKVAKDYHDQMEKELTTIAQKQQEMCKAAHETAKRAVEQSKQIMYFEQRRDEARNKVSGIRAKMAAALSARCMRKKRAIRALTIPEPISFDKIMIPPGGGTANDFVFQSPHQDKPFFFQTDKRDNQASHLLSDQEALAREMNTLHEIERLTKEYRDYDASLGNSDRMATSAKAPDKTDFTFINEYLPRDSSPQELLVGDNSAHDSSVNGDFPGRSPSPNVLVNKDHHEDVPLQSSLSRTGTSNHTPEIESITNGASTPNTISACSAGTCQCQCHHTVPVQSMELHDGRDVIRKGIDSHLIVQPMGTNVESEIMNQPMVSEMRGKAMERLMNAKLEDNTLKQSMSTKMEGNPIEQPINEEMEEKSMGKPMTPHMENANQPINSKDMTSNQPLSLNLQAKTLEQSTNADSEGKVINEIGGLPGELDSGTKVDNTGNVPNLEVNSWIKHSQQSHNLINVPSIVEQNSGYDSDVNSVGETGRLSKRKNNLKNGPINWNLQSPHSNTLYLPVRVAQMRSNADLVSQKSTDVNQRYPPEIDKNIGIRTNFVQDDRSGTSFRLENESRKNSARENESEGIVARQNQGPMQLREQCETTTSYPQKQTHVPAQPSEAVSPASQGEALVVVLNNDNVTKSSAATEFDRRKAEAKELMTQIHQEEAKLEQELSEENMAHVVAASAQKKLEKDMLKVDLLKQELEEAKAQVKKDGNEATHAQEVHEESEKKEFATKAKVDALNARLVIVQSAACDKRSITRTDSRAELGAVHGYKQGLPRGELHHTQRAHGESQWEGYRPRRKLLSVEPKQEPAEPREKHLDRPYTIININRQRKEATKSEGHSRLRRKHMHHKDESASEETSDARSVSYGREHKLRKEGHDSRSHGNMVSRAKKKHSNHPNDEFEPYKTIHGYKPYKGAQLFREANKVLANENRHIKGEHREVKKPKLVDAHARAILDEKNAHLVPDDGYHGKEIKQLEGSVQKTNGNDKLYMGDVRDSEKEMELLEKIERELDSLNVHVADQPRKGMTDNLTLNSPSMISGEVHDVISRPSRIIPNSRNVQEPVGRSLDVSENVPGIHDMVPKKEKGENISEREKFDHRVLDYNESRAKRNNPAEVRSVVKPLLRSPEKTSDKEDKELDGAVNNEMGFIHGTDKEKKLLNGGEKLQQKNTEGDEENPIPLTNGPAENRNQDLLNGNTNIGTKIKLNTSNLPKELRASLKELERNQREERERKHNPMMHGKEYKKSQNELAKKIAEEKNIELKKNIQNKSSLSRTPDKYNVRSCKNDYPQDENKEQKCSRNNAPVVMGGSHFPNEERVECNNMDVISQTKIKDMSEDTNTSSGLKNEGKNHKKSNGKVARNILPREYEQNREPLDHYQELPTLVKLTDSDHLGIPDTENGHLFVLRKNHHCDKIDFLPINHSQDVNKEDLTGDKRSNIHANDEDESHFVQIHKKSSKHVDNHEHGGNQESNYDNHTHGRNRIKISAKKNDNKLKETPRKIIQVQTNSKETAHEAFSSNPTDTNMVDKPSQVSRPNFNPHSLSNTLSDNYHFHNIPDPKTNSYDKEEFIKAMNGATIPFNIYNPEILKNKIGNVMNNEDFTRIMNKKMFKPEIPSESYPQTELVEKVSGGNNLEHSRIPPEMHPKPLSRDAPTVGEKKPQTITSMSQRDDYPKKRVNVIVSGRKREDFIKAVKEAKIIPEFYFPEKPAGKITSQELSEKKSMRYVTHENEPSDKHSENVLTGEKQSLDKQTNYPKELKDAITSVNTIRVMNKPNIPACKVISQDTLNVVSNDDVKQEPVEVDDAFNLSQDQIDNLLANVMAKQVHKSDTNTENDMKPPGVHRDLLDDNMVKSDAAMESSEFETNLQSGKINTTDTRLEPPLDNSNGPLIKSNPSMKHLSIPGHNMKLAIREDDSSAARSEQNDGADTLSPPSSLVKFTYIELIAPNSMDKISFGTNKTTLSEEKVENEILANATDQCRPTIQLSDTLNRTQITNQINTTFRDQTLKSGGSSGNEQPSIIQNSMKQETNNLTDTMVNSTCQNQTMTSRGSSGNEPPSIIPPSMRKETQHLSESRVNSTYQNQTEESEKSPGNELISTIKPSMEKETDNLTKETKNVTTAVSNITSENHIQETSNQSETTDKLLRDMLNGMYGLQLINKTQHEKYINKFINTTKDRKPPADETLPATQPDLKPDVSVCEQGASPGVKTPTCKLKPVDHNPKDDNDKNNSEINAKNVFREKNEKLKDSRAKKKLLDKIFNTENEDLTEEIALLEEQTNRSQPERSKEDEPIGKENTGDCTNGTEQRLQTSSDESSVKDKDGVSVKGVLLLLNNGEVFNVSDSGVTRDGEVQGNHPAQIEPLANTRLLLTRKNSRLKDTKLKQEMYEKIGMNTRPKFKKR